MMAAKTWPDKLSKIKALALRVENRSQRSIDITRMNVLETIIQTFLPRPEGSKVVPRPKGSEDKDLLSFLFTQEKDQTFVDWKTYIPTDEGDGKGGMFKSPALWTIIKTIINSNTFEWKEGHNIFYKDDMSGLDIYINSCCMFTRKAEQVTADAASLRPFGSQYNHQHRIRTVLSLFASKSKPQHNDSNPKQKKIAHFEPLSKGQLVTFMTGVEAGSLDPPYHKSIEEGHYELFGINFNTHRTDNGEITPPYQERRLVRIALKNGLHINEVKNILALVLLMEHELVHTMLEYIPRRSRYPPGYDFNKKKKWREEISTVPQRADENHGAWFDFFVRKLFGQVGIHASIEGALCPSKVVAASAGKVVAASAKTDTFLLDIKKLRF